MTQNADPAGGQPSWRYCDKCKGLFFGFNPGSKCPAGGEHSKANSGNYALRCFPAWPPSPCSKIAAELAEMKKREFDPELKKWVGSEATPEEIAAKQKELQECYSKYPS